MRDPDATFTVRVATADDADSIMAALMHAFNWDPSRPEISVQEVRATPELACYAAGWPKEGDLGVVAIDDANQCVGACWLRYFTDDDHGYGYISADIPELGIGIDSKWRGKGVGRELIRAISKLAKEQGIAKISLSVEKGNFAVNLYRSEGFVDFRAGETDFILVKEL